MRLFGPFTSPEPLAIRPANRSGASRGAVHGVPVQVRRNKRHKGV